MIELGVDAYCWHARLAAKELTIIDALSEASDLGAGFMRIALDYVDAAPGGIEAVTKAAETNGLGVQTNGGPIGRQYHASDASRATTAVGEWLRRAQQLGSPNLMVYSGTYYPELTRNPGSAEEELAFIREVLEGAANAAEDTGVNLLIENASDFRSDQLVTLMEQCESSFVGVFVDITNPHNVFEDQSTAIERLAPLASAGHIKDFSLTSNWTPDNYHRRGYTIEFRYPGEGVTDVHGSVAKLAEFTRDRSFPLAIEGLDSHEGVSDQLPRLTASMEVMRAALKEPQAESEEGLRRGQPA